MQSAKGDGKEESVIRHARKERRLGPSQVFMDKWFVYYDCNRELEKGIIESRLSVLL